MATKITKLSITNDKISGRGGLALILRYIAKTRLNVLISSVLLTKLKVHPKGLQMEQFLKQVLLPVTDDRRTGGDCGYVHQGRLGLRFFSGG